MQCVIGKHKVKETKLGIYQIVLFMYQIDNERCELRIEYIPEILSIFGQYSEFSKEMAILGKIENCLTNFLVTLLVVYFEISSNLHKK